MVNTRMLLLFPWLPKVGKFRSLGIHMLFPSPYFIVVKIPLESESETFTINIETTFHGVSSVVNVSVDIFILDHYKPCYQRKEGIATVCYESKMRDSSNDISI